VERGYRIDGNGNILGPNGHIHGGIRKGGKRRVPYRCFNLKFEGESGKVFVHQLQAYQKFGETVLHHGIQVRHKNGDNLDNRNSNILYGTSVDNWMDRSKEDRLAHAQFAANARKRWTDDDVRRLRKLRGRGEMVKLLAAQEGVAKSQMSDMLTRKTYRNVK